MKLRQIALLMAGALLLASCGTNDPLYPGPSAFETGHWAKVRTRPPTYFPKGLPRDHPTNARDGFWVVPGDPADSRFFIPLRDQGGLTFEQLYGEAMALAPPEKQREIARQERWDKCGEIFVGVMSSFKGL